VRVLKQGVARDGSAICPPMPVGPMGGFAALTDGDARDIAHYLLSLPPVENALTAPCNLPGTSGHSGHDAPTRPLPGAALFLHQYR